MAVLLAFSLPVRPFLLAMEAGGGGAGLLGFLLPLLLVFAVFYFFIIRPQRKQQQEHQEMVAAVAKGDKVRTIGGIHGTVTKVDEDSFLVQVDSGVKLRFSKSAIAGTGVKE